MIQKRTFSKQEIRHKLGLVLQDPFLFYGTVASNIRLYNEDLSDEDVVDAAKFVQADEFIRTLPEVKGLYEIITKWNSGVRNTKFKFL